MRGLVLIGLASAALAAAPAEARMSHTLLFGGDILPADLGGIGGLVMQPVGDPAGSLFERMFREFSAAPERLPRARPRNDMEATLEAMQDARVGFGEARPAAKTSRRRGRAFAPKS